MHACMVYMHVCMCVCMSVCKSVCMHACACVCIKLSGLAPAAWRRGAFCARTHTHTLRHTHTQTQTQTHTHTQTHDLGVCRQEWARYFKHHLTHDPHGQQAVSKSDGGGGGGGGDLHNKAGQDTLRADGQRVALRRYLTPQEQQQVCLTEWMDMHVACTWTHGVCARVRVRAPAVCVCVCVFVCVCVRACVCLCDQCDRVLGARSWTHGLCAARNEREKARAEIRTHSSHAQRRTHKEREGARERAFQCRGNRPEEVTREIRRSVECRQLAGARAGGAGEVGRCRAWAGAAGDWAVESEVFVFPKRTFRALTACREMATRRDQG